MNVKRKLGCIFAFSFICFSGCSSIEQPTFKDIIRDINSKHQSIEQETVDTTQYIGDLIKEEKLKEYYMTTFQGPYDSERVLSQQQILEDITYLFNAFHDMYGPYEYFGGAEVFNTVENEIKEEVKEYETLQAKDLEELLLKRLQFIKDGHFSINKKDLNPIKIPFFFRTHSFKKIKDGYETADGKKVRSIDGYKNLDELMKLSISPEGELVYYPVLLKNCDFRAALESPQTCEETLIIHYTNGNTEELKADSFQIYSDIDLEHPNRSKVISSRQSGEIPIFQFNQFVDRHEDRIFKGAVSLKEAPIAILDLRSNPGGELDIAEKWMTQYVGKAVPSNKIVVNTKSGQRESYEKDSWVENKQILIILVGKFSASASESLLDYAYNVENVMIVGENTSGTLIGESYEISLPNSCCQVNIGSERLSILPEEDGYFEELRGFYPDIWVPAREAETLVLKYLEKNVQ